MVVLSKLNSLKISLLKVEIITRSYFRIRIKCPYSELFWSIFSRIRPEHGQMRTRITTNTETFHAVELNVQFLSSSNYQRKNGHTTLNASYSKYQISRHAPETDGPKIDYRLVFLIPFIDKLYNELEFSFTKRLCSALYQSCFLLYQIQL